MLTLPKICPYCAVALTPDLVIWRGAMARCGRCKTVLPLTSE